MGISVVVWHGSLSYWRRIRLTFLSVDYYETCRLIKPVLFWGLWGGVGEQFNKVTGLGSAVELWLNNFLPASLAGIVGAG